MFPPAGGSGVSAVGSLSLVNTNSNTENIKKTSSSYTGYFKHQTYDLYLHNDCFTQGHTQWFYFSVKNVVVGQAINFNIKNFTKSESLFTDGMRPLLLSTRSKKGWVRAGNNIRYYYSAGNNNNTNSTNHSMFQPLIPDPGSDSHNTQGSRKEFRDGSSSSGNGSSSGNTSNGNSSNGSGNGSGGRESGSGSGSNNNSNSGNGVIGSESSQKSTPQSKQQSQSQTQTQSSKPGSYALSFTHTFEHSDDVCYFAYCLPYTYTDLRKFLNKVSKSELVTLNDTLLHSVFIIFNFDFHLHFIFILIIILKIVIFYLFILYFP